MKVGLIDIGSNTCKLLIAELNSLNTKEYFSVTEQDSLPCRLIDGKINQVYRIDNRKIELLVICLEKFKEACVKHSVKYIKTVATEALRCASNSNSICKEVEKQTGLSVEILTGYQEAMGIAQGLQTDPALKNWSDYIGLDIGGGSIEFIEVINKKVNQVKSLPLGAVRVALSSEEDISDKISPIGLENAKKYIQDIIKCELSCITTKSEKLAATGGTLVFLRKMIEEETGQPIDQPIDRISIEEIFEKSSAVSTSERIISYPSLPPDRADIFPYGLLAILEIMDFLKINCLTHSFRNLRYGLIQDLYISEQLNF